jgi:hypothetical protein
MRDLIAGYFAMLDGLRSAALAAQIDPLWSPSQLANT